MEIQDTYPPIVLVVTHSPIVTEDSDIPAALDFFVYSTPDGGFGVSSGIGGFTYFTPDGGFGSSDSFGGFTYSNRDGGYGRSLWRIYLF